MRWAIKAAPRGRDLLRKPGDVGAMQRLGRFRRRVAADEVCLHEGGLRARQSQTKERTSIEVRSHSSRSRRVS